VLESLPWKINGCFSVCCLSCTLRANIYSKYLIPHTSSKNHIAEHLLHIYCITVYRKSYLFIFSLITCEYRTIRFRYIQKRFLGRKLHIDLIGTSQEVAPKQLSDLLKLQTKISLCHKIIDPSTC